MLKFKACSSVLFTYLSFFLFFFGGVGDMECQHGELMKAHGSI
jgi:hypothetical protein